MAVNAGKRIRNLTEGPLLPQILRFALPMMATSVLQLMFNTADTIVVGRWGGDTQEACETALAAVGSCGALIMLLVNLFMGMSMGTGVCVAQAMGARSYDKVRKIIHAAVPLGFCCGCFLTVMGCLFAEPLLLLMGTEPQVLDQAAPYMRAYFCGMPASLVYNYCAASLRSTGDTTRPMFFLTLAGIANVLMNLLMVLVFNMGAVGVGIATATSHWVSALCVVVYMLRVDGPCHLELRKLQFRKDEVLAIMRIGLPAGFQNIMFNFSNVLIQSSVNSLGQVAVAANAAAANLNGYVYSIQNTLYQAALTFVGQNLGAKKYDRIKKSTFLCAVVGASVGFLIGGTMFIFGRQLLQLYAPGNTAVIEMGMKRLLWMGCTYFLCVIMEVGLGMLRGMGNSLLPTISTFVGTCVLRVGWVLFIFPLKPCLESLYMSFMISWILTGIFTYICCGKIYKKQKLQYERQLALENRQLT